MSVAAFHDVPAPSDGRASVRALGFVNFFLADVRDGLGPFLGVFLIGNGWGTDTIGYVMTIGGIAGMLATTPLGALADATRAKRAVVAFCAALVIVASGVILFLPGFGWVAASQIGTGVAAAAIAPAIAGLTLGIVGQRGLAKQLGRNEAFNHAGNGMSAALAGLLGYFYGITAVFALMAVMAAASIVAVLLIRPGDIDHDVARGLKKGARASGEQASGFSVLVKSAPLIVLGLTVALFHFGNAAMLPLLGLQVASAQTFDPTAFTAVTIIVAQATMIPMALLAARIAETRGYYLIFIAALLALPVRGLIAGLWDNPLSVFPVQILDGVGAGLLSVAVPGLVARILNGTGHINAGLGAVMTLQGVGAALSPSLAGFVADRYGFAAAFLVLGAIAGIALALWLAFSHRIKAAGAVESEPAEAGKIAGG